MNIHFFLFIVVMVWFLRNSLYFFVVLFHCQPKCLQWKLDTIFSLFVETRKKGMIHHWLLLLLPLDYSLSLLFLFSSVAFVTHSLLYITFQSGSHTLPVNRNKETRENKQVITTKSRILTIF
jgi:hypothetical protein